MRSILPRACALLLVLALAAPVAWGGDDEPPTKDPKAADPKAGDPKAGDPKAGDAKADPKAGGTSTTRGGLTRKDTPGGLTRKDIEELVRRGGRLPEGFIPHGMRPGAKPGAKPGEEPPLSEPPPVDPGAGPLPFGPPPRIHLERTDAMEAAFAKATGTLILTYLAEKDDPARAAVYEALLADVGTALAKGDGKPLAAHASAIMAKLMRNLRTAQQRRDLQTIRVYREVLRIFGQALTAGARPAQPAPPPEPMDLARFTLGGANVIPATLVADSAVRRTGLVREVPADSHAHAAGLRAGDVILTLDGKPVTPQSLGAADKAFVPGGKLRIELRRREGKLEILDLEFEADDDSE